VGLAEQATGANMYTAAFPSSSHCPLLCHTSGSVIANVLSFALCVFTFFKCWMCRATDSPSPQPPTKVIPSLSRSAAQSNHQLYTAQVSSLMGSPTKTQELEETKA
jgi:hypothetical protein